MRDMKLRQLRMIYSTSRPAAPSPTEPCPAEIKTGSCLEQCHVKISGKKSNNSCKFVAPLSDFRTRCSPLNCSCSQNSLSSLVSAWRSERVCAPPWPFLCSRESVSHSGNPSKRSRRMGQDAFVVLQFEESAVGPIPLHQLIMRSTFVNNAVFQHRDDVRAADGRQAVRNHERGPVAHQVGQCPLHQFF